MYSTKYSVLQLTSLLISFGVKQVVLCPGSRNAPIIHTLSIHPDFIVYSVTDERSAAFFALGLIQQAQHPVAVCCTSGTALLNMAPAVAEASLQGLPLLVISADRPDAWIGQMDGQTVFQPNFFGQHCKKSVHLPSGSTDEDHWHCNRLINEALSALVNPVKYGIGCAASAGPVHINIPLAEPLFSFTEQNIPPARAIRSVGARAPLLELPQDMLSSWSRAKKPMILLGQGLPDNRHTASCLAYEPQGNNPVLPIAATSYEQKEKTSFTAENRFKKNGASAGAKAIGLKELAASSPCLVLAEHIANTPFALANADSVLAALPEEQYNDFAPDLLITAGGHIVSKRLKKFLRSHPPKQHWHISPDASMPDLFQCLSHVLEACPTAVWPTLQQHAPTHSKDHEKYCSLWQRASQQAFFMCRKSAA